MTTKIAKAGAVTGAQYKDIIYEVIDQVAWITIDRPHTLNACRELTLDEITQAVLSTKNDASIACIVITGAGERAFCSGGDFDSMMRLNWVVASHWNDRMLNCAMAIRGVSIPVIAMVNGWCMGGGHELALWCDIVVASENAVFGQSGAKVGACPTVGATQYIPRIIGERLAREMIFCARRFSAQEAVQIGLANHCVPRDKLKSKTLELCETIKGHSAQTIRMTKCSLNHESDDLYSSWRAGMELLAHVWGSEESIEGMNAFVQKRKPDFNQFRLRNQQMVQEYLEGVDCSDESELKAEARRQDAHKRS
ncbi:MAG: enoyl-CoA hydratase/isomerase family protein [Parvibaculaceae bacterium]